MAKTGGKSGGSGQGRVRQFRNGRMITCTAEGCTASARVYDPQKRPVTQADVRHLDCPRVAKHAVRTGQQKQVKR